MIFRAREREVGEGGIDGRRVKERETEKEILM